MASAPTSGIAIVGMACRVAGANSPSELWEVLASSKDVRTEITRFNSGGFYKPDGGPRKGLTNVRHAYVMADGVDKFDNTFFKISPLEAEAMDPQQRILLEITYEAIENAGISLDEFEGSDTAVYTGIFGNDYHTSLLRDVDATPKYMSTGTSNSIAANRISYVFDLHGPSLVIDTACSSTMVALHQAIAALKAGECKMAVVCGANLIISPDMFVHMSELGFLSPTGRCQSFDAAGDGYARGEGVMAIILKPLEDALQNGDPIRAVIRGTRINQDGRTQGISLPSSEAQRQNLAALYQQLKLEPGSIQYLEAHGTGTAVGDPLELSAIDAVFGDSHTDQKLVVGSVKSSIGHLESCAALAGIIKTVEALERATIPPQMLFRNPNPKINFDRISIPTTLLDWPASEDGARRAGVNSFGFGGTNGHAVLEAFQSTHAAPEAFPAQRPYLFKVSAAKTVSLLEFSKSLANYVERQKPSLHDLAHTLLARRSNLRKMAFITASSHDELISQLRAESPCELTKSDKTDPKVAFVFTGQGAQWPQMGKQLLEMSPLFQSVIAECDQVLQSLPDGPSWKIAEELVKPKETSQLSKASFSQPMCTALQIGLVEIWKSWGITPHGVVGHSSGEIGAAYAAGFLSLRDAIVIAFYRGLYLGENAPIKREGPAGAMCAIGLGETECATLLKKYQGKVALAAVNSPSSCTLSGDADAIQSIVSECGETGTFCRALRVDMAYHSHHMLPLAPAYEKAMIAANVQPLSGHPTTCEMFSSVTRQKLTSNDCIPSYWRENMVSSVRFLDAFSELANHVNPDVILEVGPHPALKGPAGDILASTGKNDYQYFSSCVRGKPDYIALLETVGSLMAANLPVLASRINATQTCHGLEAKYETGRVLTDLPPYHWDHSTSFWAESRLSKNVRQRQFPRHQLLGARFHNDTPLTPSWRNVLSLKDLGNLAAALSDRPFHASVAITLLMATEAARQMIMENQVQTSRIKFENITFQHPIPFSEDPEDGVEIQLNMHQDTISDAWKLEVVSARSQNEITWVKNFGCRMSLSLDEFVLPDITKGEHDQTKLDYALSFGHIKQPDFIDFSFDEERATGRFSTPILGYENYVIDPSVFSMVLQLPELVLLASGLPATYCLDEIEALELDITMPAIENGSFCVTFPTRSTSGGKADVAFHGESGAGLVVRGMCLQRQQVIQRKPLLKSLFYKRTVHPDITRLSNAGPLHITDVTELVTTKWPMSDIGIINLDSATAAILESGLCGLESHQRPRFRSLNVVGDNYAKASSRVRTLDRFDGTIKLHFLMGKARDVRSSVSSLLQKGIVCARIEGEEDAAFFQDTFDHICDVVGLDETGWVVGRLRPMANGAVVAENVKVIAPSPVLSALSAEKSPAFEGIAMDTQSLKQWTDSSPTTDTFDAIIVDTAKTSILTGWDGSDLLYWLKFVVDRVKVLLWVSVSTNSSPHGGLSGSLLKTLQSEYPSVKFANLVFREEEDMDFIAHTTLAVYDDLIHGDNEMEFIVQDRRFHIIRYQPDDELSASVGVIPPVRGNAQYAPHLSSYQLSLSGPRSTLLLSERSGLDVPPEENTVRVLVDATVVDMADAVRFNSVKLHDQLDLGRFFTGRVYSDSEANSSSGNVVGWHTNAHRPVLDVPASQTYPIPEGVPVVDALVRYAAYATAMAVIDGIARGRPGDKLYINIPAPLGEAFAATATDLGMTVVLKPESADMTVEYANERGLHLNGVPIPVHKLIITDAAHIFATARLGHASTLDSQVSTFHIKDHRTAFERAVEQPGAVVLTHSEDSPLGNALTWYPSKKPIFRSDGAYVMIGGSGGLGQYLCSWMVQNGAKHLYILSRRGIDAAGARETAEAVQRLGGHLEVMTADAMDSDAVQKAFESIREVVPIRGCLNLAMILQDSPFSTMTGEQWDKALQVKVKTTWNLHQHTLQDDLDFFIMFSSITSISGNRTQANYATGNAFLNSMAEYRQGLGLPATSIALGATSGIGVLADNGDLIRILRQSGLDIVDAHDLEKILEASILVSRSSDHSLITVGLQMFETLDGKVQAESDQTQIFWTEWPEFGCLMDHKFQDSGAVEEVSLLDRIQDLDSDAALAALLEGFRVCLKNITGQEESSFDPASPIAMYGLDSLNAVGVRYWFFKEIGVDLPVFDILGCTSINALLERAYQKLDRQASAAEVIDIPQPVAHTDVTKRPLSNSQQRLWFLHKFLSDKTVYNLLLVCHITGSINITMFAKAWTVFMQRHEVLRSKIVETGDDLQQVPVPHMEFPLTVVDASDDSFEQQEQALTQIAKVHHFDLEGGELIRGWLLRSPTRARFFLASNHLAWDRSSAPTIFRETSAIYKSLMAGEDPEAGLDPVPFQFIDYTLWQNEWLNQESLVKPLTDYWEKQLAGIPEAVSLLPFAKKEQRPSMKEYAVGRVQRVLDAELTAKVKDFCKKHAVTPFMFVTSALGALVGRLTGDEDVLIGITDGDRGHSAFDQLVGFAVNMLALRNRISGDMPYMTLLEQFRVTCLEAYEHRAIPFDYLLRKLNIPRSTSHSPIFQITVNYQVHGGFPEVDYGDFKFTDYDHYNAKTQSDFALEVEELGTGELLCGWDFDTSLYDEAGILELAGMYKLFIQDVIAKDGAGAVGEFQITSDADMARIASLLQPSYHDEPSLDELNKSLFPVLFASAVAENPSKTALIDDHGSLTYSEMDARTNAVANTLLENGAQMGDRIGICCEQSISLVLAVYGILKAGCVYVPIDPDFPAERMSWMIEDVGISKILVDDLADKKSQQILMCGFDPKSIYEVSTVSQDDAKAIQAPVLPREIGPSDPFCCIFTSGSTGRPKGIYLGHAQLRYQMHGYNKYIGTSKDDMILLASALVFDMSLPAIFGTIQYGATMFVASREARYSPIKMIETLVTHRITNCIFTPTQLNVMLNAPNKKTLSLWKDLRSLVLGGESVSPRLVRDFFALELPQARFFNGYAPSETTVVNTLKELFPDDAGRQDIPLDVPFFPARLYILDKNMRPVPFGVPGELYIGGPNVNQGYVKRPEVTAKAFIADPFAPESETQAGFGRLYRTGDSFCISRDGTVRALGRIGSSRQIKIRSMRVELEEIENAIWSVYDGLDNEEAPPLSLVAVTYHRRGELDGLLTAYLALSGAIDLPEEEQRRLTGYLRLTLKATLPIHMQPAAYVFVRDLPRTITGKVDHLTIASWPAPTVRVAGGDGSTNEPLSETESVVASVWRDVLQIAEDLSPSDDLFALGGHSLMLLQVQRKIEDICGVTVSLAEMFANPSLREMGYLLAQRQRVSDNTGEADSTEAASNEHGLQASIDWRKETVLREPEWKVAHAAEVVPPTAIVVTGATAMIGAHFVHLMLNSSSANVHCIGVEAPTDDEARSRVLSTFYQWNLQDIPSEALDRLHVYHGSLSHSSLGLSEDAVHRLDEQADRIYHFESDVSLLKNYELLRQSNIGSLHFLIDLARGAQSGKVKTLHYLSSWGVPHLQSWTTTKLATPQGYINGEEELTNMVPGSENTLGYLKCRWVCEALLYEAARRGLPVSIYRACMCGSASTSGRGLDRTDINRRILEACLQTGLVPDFHSASGGGMSWISVDYLVRSIEFLSNKSSDIVGQARIFNYQAEKHIQYADLAAVLGGDAASGGVSLKTVAPAEWFQALRKSQNPDMIMQAEVLEQWFEAGWTAFALEGQTCEVLAREAGLVPPTVTREFLLDQVVGKWE